MIESKNINDCPICNDTKWSVVYEGKVRDGSFGQCVESTVLECNDCGIRKLNERHCLKIKDYEETNYRKKLSQSHSYDKYIKEHEPLLKFVFDSIWPKSLRCELVADIGCGAGILLDHLAKLSKNQIAVEPNREFKEILNKKYNYFSCISEAIHRYRNKVDFCFSNQVIEHVDDPFSFLRSIFDLTSPSGSVLLSTPNLDDVLMKILPDDYPSFFYRTQHRWYFNNSTLAAVAKKVVFINIKVMHIHRYGISNMLNWVSHKKPMGNKNLDFRDNHLDVLWKSWVEDRGYSDNLFIYAEKPQIT